MSTKTALIAAAASAGGGPTVFIEDHFNTSLYVGTSASQNITTGLDLDANDGMIWISPRNITYGHSLADTLRGNDQLIHPHTNGPEQDFSAGSGALKFSSTGYSVGTFNETNDATYDYVGWSWKKQPRFFDVLTYTGNGVGGTEITHELGMKPGFILIKHTSFSDSWAVWHRSVPDRYGVLDGNDVFYSAGAATIFGNGTITVEPTDTTITIGTATRINANTEEYVAYVFAHDPLGEEGDGVNGLIACGSYTGNGSATGPVISLGWEPQWILLKDTDVSNEWRLFDTMRGIVTEGDDAYLTPDTTASEVLTERLSVHPDGFQIDSGNSNTNANGREYIYVAIRRPMKTPTAGSEIYDTTDKSGGPPAAAASFPVDYAIRRASTATTDQFMSSRLTQGNYMVVNETDVELPSPTAYVFDFSTGWWGVNQTDAADYSWMFGRAPKCIEVVTYKGDGIGGRTVAHNLKATPELMIVKGRSITSNWFTYHEAIGSTKYVSINVDNAEFTATSVWNDTDPDADEFVVGTSVNNNGSNYIALLFATLAGITKVGSYTGDGTTGRTIGCGFSTGARFIMIKRTDTTGDWFVWDTFRGIVAGNDPHISFNTDANHVTTDDSIDPESTGFIVNQDAATDINVNTAEYIFLAIA